MRAHNVLCNSYNTRPLLCARIACYVTVITVEISMIRCFYHKAETVFIYFVIASQTLHVLLQKPDMIPLPTDRLNVSKYAIVNYTSSSLRANHNHKRCIQKLHTIKCLTDLMQCHPMNRDAFCTICTDLYVGWVLEEEIRKCNETTRRWDSNCVGESKRMFLTNGVPLSSWAAFYRRPRWHTD
jgi:hypothetical protein